MLLNLKIRLQQTGPVTSAPHRAPPQQARGPRGWGPASVPPVRCDRSWNVYLKNPFLARKQKWASPTLTFERKLLARPQLQACHSEERCLRRGISIYSGRFLVTLGMTTVRKVRVREI